MESLHRVLRDPMADSLTVVKVGGSLLRNSSDLKRISQALAERRESGTALLVVASALKGVTDLLERAALQALDERRNGNRLEQTVNELRQRHEELAIELPDADKTRGQIRAVLDDVDRLLEIVRQTGELSEHIYCRLLSSGERLSVPLLAAAIHGAGQAARSITAEEIGLRAAGAPRSGHCDLDASAKAFANLWADLRSEIMVLTGFYGIDEDGELILFGRGGSDDTACAVAAGLEAERLELWKDVQGFMSADPKAIAEAHLVPELSFDEVAQLGAYGSSIVHYGCLQPLSGHRTSIFICSINGTIATGTRLVEKITRPSSDIVALTASKGRAELRLPCQRAGDAGRVLTALAEDGITVKALQCRDDLLKITLSALDVEPATTILRELLGERTFEVRHFPALVAAVGDGVADDPRARAELIECLETLEIGGELVAQPAGNAGLSCTVREEDLMPALIGLHERFFKPNASQPLSSHDPGTAHKAVGRRAR